MMIKLIDVIHATVCGHISQVYSGIFPEKLEFVNDRSVLFPTINKKDLTIHYGVLTDFIVFLYNCSSRKLLLYYYLGLCCLENNDYHNAHLFIQKFIDAINRNPYWCTIDISSLYNKSIFQILFIILHELGHAYFFINSEEKVKYEEKIRQINSEYFEMLSPHFTNKQYCDYLEHDHYCISKFVNF